MNPLYILWEYRDAFLSGFWITFQLVVYSAVIGTTVGVVLGWLANSFSTLARVLNGIAFAVAAIPALVLLFWLHYPAQALLNVVVPPFWTALVTLTTINCFAVYRMTAEALSQFPKQYISTGLVCGLSQWQIFRHIEVPLLVRAISPRWLDQQVIILQTSVFASLISVEETFRVAQRVNSVVYQPVVIYTAMALLFLATAGSGMYYANRLRRKHERDLSER